MHDARYSIVIMTPITIPKDLSKNGDLVIIPSKEYELLLRTAKRQHLKKFQQELDKGLGEALEDVKAGRVNGPFHSVDELMHHLEK